MNVRDLSNYQTILERCDDVIAKFKEIDYSHKVWEHNLMTRDSILFSLSQVGELVSCFKSDEYEELFPEIPWRQVKGQRNYIVHQYAEMNYETAWESAVTGVPAIREALLSNGEIARKYETERSYISPELPEVMEGLEEDLDGMMDAKVAEAEFVNPDEELEENGIQAPSKPYDDSEYDDQH